MKIIRKLYDWVLRWADTPYGAPALFILAFIESSFFPVPPDVLLMALSLSKPKRAFYYALICTVGSVLGGMLGYYIGMEFWDIGKKIMFHYVDKGTFDHVKDVFTQYDAWAIFIAGFTPIPYKVFTISAGFFKISFGVFVVASVCSRGARFFMVSGLIYLFGAPVKKFIDKYFNLLTILFVVLLVGGFVIVKLLYK